MPPTLANGKVCYIEIPAIDISRSADVYARVFGWRIRQRGDGPLTDSFLLAAVLHRSSVA